MKTSELTGAALDWAVAKAEGLGYRYDEKYGPMCFRPSVTKGTAVWDSAPLPYSTDWAQGGPIIERERISIRQWTNVPIVHAYMPVDGAEWSSDGTSPLIAAMRCFIASKLGDEVDVPKELL